MWNPPCEAQISGLAVATFITLLLVSVLYSIAALDLKIVRWDIGEGSGVYESRDYRRRAGGAVGSHRCRNS